MGNNKVKIKGRLEKTKNQPAKLLSNKTISAQVSYNTSRSRPQNKQ